MNPPPTTLFSQFLEAMKDPEYGFLFIEPLLIYGIGFGLLAFLFASLVQEQKTQVFGLVIIVASCMMVGPYVNKRLASQKRVTAVYQIDYPEKAGSFQETTKRWKGATWVYYVTAALGTLTLIVGLGKSRTGVVLAILTVAFGLSSAIYACLAHYRESLDKHPTLRAHYAEKVDPPPPGPVLTNAPPPVSAYPHGE